MRQPWTRVDQRYLWARRPPSSGARWRHERLTGNEARLRWRCVSYALARGRRCSAPCVRLLGGVSMSEGAALRLEEAEVLPASRAALRAFLANFRAAFASLAASASLCAASSAFLAFAAAFAAFRASRSAAWTAWPEMGGSAHALPFADCATSSAVGKGASSGEGTALFSTGSSPVVVCCFSRSASSPMISPRTNPLMSIRRACSSLAVAVSDRRGTSFCVLTVLFPPIARALAPA